MLQNGITSLAKQKLSDLCYKLFFHIRPTKMILFSIKLNEAISWNKIKTILFCFLKTLPISHELLLLLQSQTKVTFWSHPKISSIFCNHISWCKKWSERPFPCHCSTISPLLGLKNNPSEHILNFRTWDIIHFWQCLTCKYEQCVLPKHQIFPRTVSKLIYGLLSCHPWFLRIF